MNEQTKEGIVDIRGLEYKTVALRVTEFRNERPDWTIETEVIDPGEYVTVKATILNEAGRVIATGHASEERGVGMVNETSALENAETSAVGRALAFYKYPGQFLRSADEMGDALIQQAINEAANEYKQRGLVIQTIIPQIAEIKDRLADDDYHAAAEVLLNFTDEQLYALRLAPTKGGVFTVEENKKMGTDEFFHAKQAIGRSE
jgi:hypothetical protein